MNAEKLLEIIDRNELNSFKALVQNALDVRQIHVAFLGAFSAGKTSLINSILNTKLPVDENPTTKSICFIEPVCVEGQGKYYELSESKKKDIGFNDFYGILSGDRKGVVGIRVKSQEVLPNGVVFVDTPGVDNAITDESDYTKSFLPFMDAAVFCIKGTNGTIRNNLVEFLNRPDIDYVRDKLLFVVTRKDRLTDDACKNVKHEIATQVSSLLNISIHEAENRILMVCAKEGANNAAEFCSFIKTCILSDVEQLRENRSQMELKKVAASVCSVLKTQLNTMEIPPDDAKQKLEEYSKTKAHLEASLAGRKEKLDSIQYELQNLIFASLLEHKSNVVDSPSEKQADAVKTMIKSTLDKVHDYIETYVKDFEISRHLLDSSSAELLSSFATSQNVKNVTSTAITAALIAWVGPAEGAGNVVEAVIGAVITGKLPSLQQEDDDKSKSKENKQGQNNSPSGTSSSNEARTKENNSENNSNSDSNNNTNKTPEKNTSQNSNADHKKNSNANGEGPSSANGNQVTGDNDRDKKSPKSQNVVQSVVKGVLSNLNEANPINNVGNLVAKKYQGDKFAHFAQSQSILLAAAVVKALEKPYQEQQLKPLIESIENHRKILTNIIESSKERRNQFFEKQTQMQQDIASLMLIN